MFLGCSTDTVFLLKLQTRTVTMCSNMLHLQTVIAVISGETFRNKQYKILGCFI